MCVWKQFSGHVFLIIPLRRQVMRKISVEKLYEKLYGCILILTCTKIKTNKENRQSKTINRENNFFEERGTFFTQRGWAVGLALKTIYSTINRFSYQVTANENSARINQEKCLNLDVRKWIRYLIQYHIKVNRIREYDLQFFFFFFQWISSASWCSWSSSLYYWLTCWSPWWATLTKKSQKQGTSGNGRLVNDSNNFYTVTQATRYRYTILHCF